MWGLKDTRFLGAFGPGRWASLRKRTGKWLPFPGGRDCSQAKQVCKVLCLANLAQASCNQIRHVAGVQGNLRNVHSYFLVCDPPWH